MSDKSKKFFLVGTFKSASEEDTKKLGFAFAKVANALYLRGYQLENKFTSKDTPMLIGIHGTPQNGKTTFTRGILDNLATLKDTNIEALPKLGNKINNKDNSNFDRIIADSLNILSAHKHKTQMRAYDEKAINRTIDLLSINELDECEEHIQLKEHAKTFFPPERKLTGIDFVEHITAKEKCAGFIKIEKNEEDERIVTIFIDQHPQDLPAVQIFLDKTIDLHI